MIIEKVGELPVNSRCTIDYTKSPPDIQFEYPDKDTRVVRRSSVTLLIAMFIAGFIVLGFAMYSESSIFKAHALTINQAFIYNNNSILVNYTFNGETYYTKITPSYEGFFWTVISLRSENIRGSFEILIQGLLLIGGFFLLTISLSYVIGFLFRKTKFGQKTFPELNKKMHDKDYSADFTPEDIVDNKVELPLFKNMYLDYEATGDCSAQLIKISIIEHPFSKLVKRHGHYMYKKEKKKPQVYLWKAIFEFKEKPKDGKLEIHFT